MVELKVIQAQHIQ